MVYTRVHSSPFLCRLLPFFSREYVLVSWWFHPRVLTLRALGSYTVCSGGAYTMSAGGMATYVANG